VGYNSVDDNADISTFV